MIFQSRTTKADFTGAILRRADFTRTNLTEADFTRVDFRNTNLTNTNLTRAILTDVKNPETIRMDVPANFSEVTCSDADKEFIREQQKIFIKAQKEEREALDEIKKKYKEIIAGKKAVDEEVEKAFIDWDESEYAKGKKSYTLWYSRFERVTREIKQEIIEEKIMSSASATNQNTMITPEQAVQEGRINNGNEIEKQ